MKNGLTNFEYAKICEKLGRRPNGLEEYLFSAMWSEHCGYKHSGKYLAALPRKKSVLSGENSGGIRIGRHVIFFKTESHNHPSAVEPYQGAATGIGGILRDVLAMNARPIALLNSLKFGPIEPKAGEKADDKSIRRNKYLLNRVVEGISDYGNSTGVPTIGGEVSFNDCFNLSPLVNVMAVGLCHKDKIKTARVKENSYIVLIGSTTGRDGLFGASFASKELENNFEDKLSVQIGDPYTKKRVIEATLEILASKNVNSAQDLGAAGLLSSTSEMAAKGGVAVDLWLEKVPLREKNMEPYEIMLSESQERMVFGANKKGVDEIFKICKKYELNASVIGKTRKGNTYNLYYNSKLEASVPVKALTEPILYDLHPKKQGPANDLEHKKFILPKEANTKAYIRNLIFKMAAAPEFASKKYIYSQYDSTVGARTLLNPHSLGVSPLYIFEENAVISLSMDSNERASAINPYQGAVNTVYESFRNAVSSGFEPLGITDCLNFANPETPEVAKQFIDTIKGLKDALEILNIPVVSGNVSFYNEGIRKDRGKIKIHPAPNIGTLSLLKFETPIYSVIEPDNTLYLIGKRLVPGQSGGDSLYKYIFFDFIGGKLDRIDFELEMKLKKAVFDFKGKGLISGAIDVSKGGMLGALLIMLFNTKNHSPESNLGFKGNLNADIDTLFGEITGRYLVATRHIGKIENYLNKHKIPFENLGTADTSGVLDIGFAKINFAELTQIYNGALERKV